MTNIIHIIPEPPNIKNNIKKVEKRIKEASNEISKAKGELNNANHSELSYEINQLESMYKKNNQYASEFETFASKVETMVNEYITADKNCANKIRSNGKSHRQNTGLPKGLGSALISSTFEKIGDFFGKIGDIIEDGLDPIKKLVKEIWENYPATMYIDDILRWISELPFAEVIEEIWKNALSITGNLLQIGLGALALASGVGAVPGLIAIVMGFDKMWGTILFDGKTTPLKEFLFPDFLPDWVVNIVYEGVDLLSGGFFAKAGAALSKIDKAAEVITGCQKLLGKINDVTSYLDIIKNDGNGLFDKLGKELYKKLFKLPSKNYSYDLPNGSSVVTA